VRLKLAAALAILLVSAAGASAQDKPLPKFGDYPVKTVYKGKHAKPRIYGDLKRYYESSYTSAIEAASPSRANMQSPRAPAARPA